MADQIVTLRITADGKAAITAINKVDSGLDGLGASGKRAGGKAAAGMGHAATAVKKYGKTVERTARKTARSHKRMADGVDSISQQLARLEKWAVRVGAIAGFASAVSKIARMADEYTNLNSRLKLVTETSREAANVQNELFEIAQRSRSALGSTGSLYVKLAQATKEMNLSQQKMLRITETVNKAFVVSGAGAQEAAAAIQQLSQGLASGVLRGDEFNSVAEQAPVIMDMLAKSLNVTRGELRGMAAEGKLTAEVLVNALGEGAADVDAKFANMQLTIGGAFQQLKNAVSQFVGEAGKASGVASALADSIGFIAKNLGTLVAVAGAALLAWMAKVAVQLTTQAALWATNTGAVLAYRAEVARLAGSNLAGSLSASAAGMTRLGQAIPKVVAGLGLAAAAAAAAMYAVNAYFDALDEGSTRNMDAMKTTNSLTQAVIAYRRQLVGAAGDIESMPKLTAMFGTREQITKKLADVQERLAKTQEKLNESNRKTWDSFKRTGNVMELVVNISNDKLNPAQRATRKEAEQLKDMADLLNRALKSLDQTTINVAESFSRDLQSSLDDAIAKFRQADGVIETVKAAIAGLLNLGTAFNAAAGQKMLDQLKDATAANEAATAEIERSKMSHVERAQALIADANAIASLNGTTDASRKALAEWSANLLASAQALDAVNAATSSPKVNESISAYDQLMGRIAERTQGYMDDLDNLTQAQVTYREEIARLVELYEQGAISKDKFFAGRDMAQAEFRAAQDAAKDDKKPKKPGVDYVKQAKAAAAYKAQLVGLSDAQRRVAETVASAKAAWGELNESQQASYGSITEYLAEAEKVGETMAALEISDSMLKPDYFQGLADSIDIFESALRTTRMEMQTIAEQMAQLPEGSDQYETLEAQFDKLNEKAETFGEKLRSLSLERLGAIAGVAAQGLRGIQSLTKEGSKEYEALNIAASALAGVQAVSAIINQGSSGDPYSAFARMAAMAAALAPILASIGQSISSVKASGFTDTAKQRQETQGTGTVLGDAAAKSESILNATEITANATEKLVGINTGMLRAMQALQKGIGSATGMLARGAGQMEFNPLDFSVEGDMDGVIDAIGGIVTLGLSLLGGFGDFLGDLWRKIWGGKTKVTDQGIKIFGGTLMDLIENIAVGAYAEVQSKSWAFGSTHTNEVVQDVSDALQSQFQLILQSIVDAVREGALALGLLPDDIQRAIEKFRIEAKNISLKGLSAEEQQEELQAVFSQIFDNLAGAVVPFIEQFQQVGEGLGETLIRVATEVQVFREAVKRLGLAVDDTDPERFARIADGLTQMMGGIEAFITGMQAFVRNFAPEAHQFEVAQNAITSAFEQVGLVLPDTREALWELMQSIDASTEEGQRKIATLLQLADVTDQYYDTLEKRAKELASLAAKFRDAVFTSDEIDQYRIDTLTDTASKELADVGLSSDTTMAQFRDAYFAVADTLTDEELRQWYEAGIALGALDDAIGKTGEMAKVATVDIRALVDALNAYAAKSEQLRIDALDNEFDRSMANIQMWVRDTVAELNRLAKAAGKSGAAVEDLTNVHEIAARRMAALIDQLRAKARSLVQELYGQNSANMTLDQLNARIAELQGAANSAGSGISQAVDQINESARLLFGDLSPYKDAQRLEFAKQAFLSGNASAEDVLRIGRDMYASTWQYKELFDWVQSNNKSQDSGTAAVQQVANAVRYNAEELARLIDRRDELLEQQRFTKAVELAETVARLAQSTGDSFSEIAEELGFSLEDLGKDLGVDNILDYLQEQVNDIPQNVIRESAVTVADVIRKSSDDIVAAIWNTSPYGDPTGGFRTTPADITRPDGPTIGGPYAPEHVPHGPYDIDRPGVPAPVETTSPHVESRLDKQQEQLNAIAQILGRYLPRVAEDSERTAGATAQIADDTRESLDSRQAIPRRAPSTQLVD